MRVLWTNEALDDLAEIVAYYYAEASPRTTELVERRILEQVEGLPPFPRTHPEKRPDSRCARVRREPTALHRFREGAARRNRGSERHPRRAEVPCVSLARPTLSMPI